MVHDIDAARPGSPAAAAPSIVFGFDNTYARELDGTFAVQDPQPVRAPTMVRFNRELADELGLDADALDSAEGTAVFAGNAIPHGATPLAQAYAGHQFGGFSPQLGDGRAVLLGEVVDPVGRRFDIALKGSGRTPFSRGGDGRATLGPILREYLMGEAMHALDIPTTRALAAVTTGEPVARDAILPGAVLTRVASSHLRVGTFQFFAVRDREDLLGDLLTYAISRHDPELVDSPRPALDFLCAVLDRQAALIAAWMHVGFIHGVMNTDNTTISGETIDFGPCAFVDAHDPQAVFSSIDHGGRYAYGNQPQIGQWNLTRLAESLLPLIDSDTDRAVAAATEVLATYPDVYRAHWVRGARTKLGLTDEQPDDGTLADDWVELLAAQRVDHTLAWRHLGDAVTGSTQRLRSLFAHTAPLDAWLSRWSSRCGAADGVARRAAMHAVNPIYIPRNELVEEALTAAVHDDDLAPFDRLLTVVRAPYTERDGDARFALPAPEGFTARYQTFCGT